MKKISWKYTVIPGDELFNVKESLKNVHGNCIGTIVAKVYIAI